MIFQWLVAYVARGLGFVSRFPDHVNNYTAIIPESSRQIFDEQGEMLVNETIRD